MKNRALFAFGLASGLVALAAGALAQRLEVRSPLTLTVGAPEGPEPTVRGDARRDGVLRDVLPRAPIHVDWRFSIGGGQIDQAPIVSREAIIVTTSHGEVVWIPHDGRDGGAELGRQSTGIASATTTPPTLLSNGTVVVVGGANEAIAVGVDKTGVRFRTPLGSPPPDTDGIDSVTPLALADGGIALATATEMLLLDSAGNVRARAALPEPLVGPLVASTNGRKILGVSKNGGVVYAWSPGESGGRDVTRVGSFQQKSDTHLQGGAALAADGSTMVAVVDDTRLMTLDLRQGLAVPLSTFANGAYLGPVALRGNVAYAMAGTSGRTFVVGVDTTNGQEVMRTQIATQTVTSPDGGPVFYVPPPHVPVAVDDTGTIAFAAPEGAIGIVDPAGVAASVDGICTRGLRSSRGVTSLASGGPGAFIVTCNGNVIRITHE